MEKTYGGHTVAALHEFLQHGDDTGETIDELTGDESSSANIIRDLLDGIPSDAAQAPIYQYRMVSGEWIDFPEQDGRMHIERGHTVRIVYAAPVAPAAPTPTVAADAAAPSTGMERAFSSSSMGRRDEMALLNRHAETPRLLALLGLPLIDSISLYDVRIRLENALTDTEAEAAEDAYVAQRMTQLLAEVYANIIGDDARPEDEALPVIERVKKAAQVLRLEVDLYRAQRDEAADQPTEQRMSDAEDAARLDWLREECCDLRSISVPTGGDDADVNWVVIQHHMAEPREREIGRGFSDDPRDAIDAARKGDSQ